jgi:hypothetical protein
MKDIISSGQSAIAQKELVEQDIMEKVNKPSRRVSPIVCTIRKTQELGMCVDMRAANEAIYR